MSRSRKKSPHLCVVGGNNGKEFRRAAHSAMRARTKALIAQGRFEDVPTKMEEVSSIYDYKDWSTYVTSDDSDRHKEAVQKQMRKK
jgi:hypothetical protein